MFVVLAVLVVVKVTVMVVLVVSIKGLVEVDIFLILLLLASVLMEFHEGLLVDVVDGLDAEVGLRLTRAG